MGNRIVFGQIFKISEVPFTVYTSPDLVSLELDSQTWILYLKESLQRIESPHILGVSQLNKTQSLYAESFGNAIGMEGTIYETYPFCPDWILV
jgi:hypothetical protein